MKASLLKILVCPACHESLAFDGIRSHSRLIRGFLHCSNGHLYQVKDEIPVTKDPKTSQNEFVWKVEFPNIESYDSIQKQYRSYLSKEQKEADEALINELVRNVSREKLVLDVASGMGRLLLVLSHSLQKKPLF